MEEKINALMLRAIDYKDNDKILTLLSPELGKISAGIRGVKKAGAKLRFAAQPFCFAEYILVKKGDKYTVVQATENESFYDLRTDLNKFYAAACVCEVASALSYEGEEGGQVFSAAVRALSQMCAGDECLALLSFLLTALGQTGYGLALDRCEECGADLTAAQKMRFDFQTGAFTCWDCGTGEGVSAVTYHTLRFLSGKSYGEEYLTDDGKKRALRLLKEYFAHKTDNRCYSLSEYLRML